MEKMERIRELNDQFRKQLVGGRLLLTQGVLSLKDPNRAVRLMQEFDAFTEDSDPYRERDFASFETEGKTLFFKIDYFAPSLTEASSDPSNPEITTRVLTLMLAEEY